MSPLVEQIERAILSEGLLSRGERVLLAVSGGLDSVVLAHVLHALAPAHGWRLTIGHFNHQLRGLASDGDAQFVQDLAKRLGLKCQIGGGDVRAHAAARGLSIEMAARELRHQFLAGTAEQCRMGKIATAHHADDQVELFFLRLLRGAGPDGLKGMRALAPSPMNPNVQLVRPLLSVGKAELEAFAQAQRLRYRPDASNQSPVYLRNRVRHELLPLLRTQFQPALDRVVRRLMTILADESDFVAAASQDLELSSRPFDTTHPALQRRCLATACLRLGITPELDLIERLRLAAGVEVMVRPDLIVWRDETGQVQSRTPVPEASLKSMAVTLEGPGGEVAFGGMTICWRIRRVRSKATSALRPMPGFEVFDADKVGAQITLRHWRPGDRFQPIGMSRPVKIQDFLTNLKVPRAERSRLVLAESASGPASIFWIEGRRISERFKVDAGTSRRLEWRWERAGNKELS